MTPNLVEIECESCDGTGQCTNCAGWGQDTDGVECPYCNGGSGKCVACNGSGAILVIDDEELDEGEWFIFSNAL